MHCEDHGRHDLVVPHGHHQGVHQQPLPGRAHLQTEEHQQVGADPAQPTATIQVRRRPVNSLNTSHRKWSWDLQSWRVDNLSRSRLSGIRTRWCERGPRKCSLRQWEEIQLVIWHKPIIRLSGKYFPPDFNSQLFSTARVSSETLYAPKIAKNSKLRITAASFNGPVTSLVRCAECIFRCVGSILNLDEARLYPVPKSQGKNNISACF